LRAFVCFTAETKRGCGMENDKTTVENILIALFFSTIYGIIGNAEAEVLK
jgi:hypothetical protein